MTNDPINHGIPTVRFDVSQVTEEIRNDLRRNILEIGEVPADKIEEIYIAALATIEAGGNLPIIYQALLKLDDLTKRRASDISMSLNRKAMALMEVAKQKRIGIKQAIWLYSGAPCDTHDAAHHAANGKRYRVEEGMLIKGVPTWPGRENGCKCVSRPVIPGFE
jgi:uncharacterized protein with gpF-like domain